jgi:hypothetical protein
VKYYWKLILHAPLIINTLRLFEIDMTDMYYIFSNVLGAKRTKKLRIHANHDQRKFQVEILHLYARASKEEQEQIKQRCNETGCDYSFE